MEVLAGEQTPLHIAVCLGLIPLVEEALLRFKDGTNSMQSPLHLAAKFMSGAYKILISTGKRWILTNRDEDGNTPLHQAAIFGHSSMMKGLVEKFTGDSAYGKEINEKNNSGNTPLHLAVQFDHKEMVGFLVEKGADINIKNSAQLAASGLGEKLGRGDIVNFLLKQEEIQRPKPAVEPARKPTRKHSRRPSRRSSQKPERKPERGLWSTVGGFLGELCQGRREAPEQGPGTTQEEVRRRPRRRTQSHHRTTH